MLSVKPPNTMPVAPFGGGDLCGYLKPTTRRDTALRRTSPPTTQRSVGGDRVTADARLSRALGPRCPITLLSA